MWSKVYETARFPSACQAFCPIRVRRVGDINRLLHGRRRIIITTIIIIIIDIFKVA